MIRAWLLDDEELAVRRLVRLLEQTGRVHIAGSSTDSQAAVAAVREAAPDVIFLDIHMPGLNGFQFLDALHPVQPSVVFTTAFHEHALKAFEVNSVDYLLKPVEMPQLDRALGKLERILRGAEVRPDVHHLMQQLASALQSSAPSYPARLPSRTGDRVEFVDLGAVSHFYAKEKLTFASTTAKDYCVDGSIIELEAKLDPRRFVRIHRATMVNLEHIHELFTWFGGKVLIRLKDGKTELTVSRDRVKELKERLNL